mmetsp:Transcript_12333/g.29368  ORF Transcript_12333/g.29368 Transcript_12333/m.29368 type:complete len:89 (+) Transcript_12333:1008-1274(+)
MIRLLFNRKNKTLRSVLFTKATLRLLEENRRTLRSLEGQSNTEEKARDILERILSQPRYKDKRAKNLDLDDFLHLLAEFHREGIHFTS